MISKQSCTDPQTKIFWGLPRLTYITCFKCFFLRPAFQDPSPVQESRPPTCHRQQQHLTFGMSVIGAVLLYWIVSLLRPGHLLVTDRMPHPPDLGIQRI